jgi:hypothetical protein
LPVPDDPEPTGEEPAGEEPQPASLVCEEHELPDGRYLLAYRRAEHA